MAGECALHDLDKQRFLAARHMMIKRRVIEPNLARDIAEEKDLSAAEPAKRDELVAAWQALNQGMIAPLWNPGGGRGP